MPKINWSGQGDSHQKVLTYLYFATPWCPENSSSFKMLFHADLDGVFRLDEKWEHDCQALLPTIKRVWIRKKIEEMKREDGKIKPKAIQMRFKEKFKIDVGKVLIANALSDVKKEQTKTDQSFGLTTSFLDAVAINNEGTTVRLMSDGEVFQRAFLCPGICKDAFMHTVMISGLDACHIKAPYGGALLVMTALDGNGQIFPVALGIAESENYSTWTWFIDLVKTALDIQDGGEGLVFLSDREKGIETSLNEVLPRATHGYCVFHIQKNVKKHFHTALNGLLFKAARAATVQDFKDVMREIQSINPAALEYIKGIDGNKWARAFFKGRRLGHVTSNIAESANWWLEEARHQYLVGLFSTFIWTVNTLFDNRRKEYAAMGQNTLPKRVFELLEESVKKAGGLRVRRHNDDVYEVERLNKRRVFRVVDMGARTCSCGFFAEYGVPCRHMCAAILSVREDPKQYVVPERRREALVATYVGTIRPVDVSSLVDDGMKPPIGTKRRGRPNEKRIPSVAETQTKRTVRCGRCRGYGHNSRSCKKQSN